MTKQTPPAAPAEAPEAAATYMVAQLKEQALPILAAIDAGTLDTLGGAQQLIQTFGGFTDVLPESAQKLLRETARQLVIYMGGNLPPAVSPTREQVAAATPLVDAERIELESLRQIVATLNSSQSLETPAKYVGKPILEPGEPGYDPAKDTRV